VHEFALAILHRRSRPGFRARTGPAVLVSKPGRRAQQTLQHMGVHVETCGDALGVEHNGDVNAYDDFVEPKHLRGNLHRTPLSVLVDAPERTRFGDAKRDALPQKCRAWAIRFACHGGCPKDRVTRTQAGEPGLN
jgi:radical SAM protein with 4Fe4S-binding SPASM domain